MEPRHFERIFLGVETSVALLNIEKALLSHQDILSFDSTSAEWSWIGSRILSFCTRTSQIMVCQKR